MNRGLPSADRLIASDPFEFTPHTSELFLENFREAAQRHFEGSRALRAFWESAGISPKSIRTEADLIRVPPLLVTLFKEHEWASIPETEVALRLTSSGTTGQKSQIILNAGSLDRVKRLAFRIHEQLGMTSDEECNYLCFTYDPHVAKDLGTAFTDELLTQFTGRKEIYYAFQWSSARGDFVLNEDEVLATLKRFEKSGSPVRILGFPAFLHRLLQRPDATFRLGAKSWVQTGGGWKGLAKEEIPKAQFREVVARKLGIPVENVRDLFGMVEHGIPYVDCSKGRLHVPNFARIFVRKPNRVLTVLPEGEVGLLQFLCAYNDSYPTLSLLTTDWGRLGRCDCGIPGQTLEIVGRAGTTQHKGCAIHAAEKFA